MLRQISTTARLRLERQRTIQVLGPEVYDALSTATAGLQTQATVRRKRPLPHRAIVDSSPSSDSRHPGEPDEVPISWVV